MNLLVKVRKDSLEEHKKAADEVGDSRVADHDTEEEDDARGGQVEHDEDEDEAPEGFDGGNEADWCVDDGAKDEGRDDSEGDDVEQDLGGKVGGGAVVTVGALSSEE